MIFANEKLAIRDDTATGVDNGFAPTGANHKQADKLKLALFSLQKGAVYAIIQQNTTPEGV